MIKRAKGYDNSPRCKLNMRFDGDNNGTSFPDSSIYNRSASTVGASTVTKTAVKKFGTASCYCAGDNNTKLIFDDSADWDTTTQDFTISLWYYPIAIPTVNYQDFLITQWGANSTYRAFNIQIERSATANYWVVYFYNSTQVYTYRKTTGTVATATWYNYVFGRNKGVYYVYVNGIPIDGASWSLDPTNITMNSVASPIRFFFNSDATDRTPYGYMDQAQIIIGRSLFNRNFKVPNRAA